MGLSELPTELLSLVGEAVGIRSLAAYLSSCCTVAAAKEPACELLAAARYPAAGLAAGRPAYTSAAALLADDNAQGGMWCFDLGAESLWKHNGMHGLHYANRLQRAAWCGLTGHLIVVIDAAGETDLRAAHKTCLVAKSIISRVECILTPVAHEYRVQGAGRQVCELCFALDVANRAVKFARLDFLFNGLPAGHFDTSRSDYPRTSMLLSTVEFWLDEFCRPGRPLPAGASARTFEPRPLPYDTKAQGPGTWSLPNPVLARWQSGTWGQI
jgi:hypothetical protein